jgi:hypothetical protein
MTRDATQPFNGEDQIQKTLTSNPLKLYLDVEKEFDAGPRQGPGSALAREPGRTRWSDGQDRYAEQAGMPWLPPKGLETLKTIACNRGLWEDLGNGYVTKKPKKKRTSVQVIAESDPRRHRHRPIAHQSPERRPGAADLCRRRRPGLRSQPPTERPDLHHQGPARQLPDPRSVGPVRDGRPGDLVQQAGDPRNLVEKAANAPSNCSSRPRGTIRYTLDGSEPREGTEYQKTRSRSATARSVARLCRSGRSGGQGRIPLSGQRQERRPDRRRQTGQSGVPHRPQARLAGQDLRRAESGCRQVGHVRGHRVDRRAGHPDDRVNVGDIAVDADFIQALLNKVLEKFPPDTPDHHDVPQGPLPSGHDLKDFAEKLGIELTAGDVQQ